MYTTMIGNVEVTIDIEKGVKDGPDRLIAITKSYLDVNLGKSSTGKSVNIATTNGNATLTLPEQFAKLGPIKFGVNCFRVLPKSEWPKEESK